ncbi:hypothetical protein D918_01194 [Trichuris suis]|nr:hypothetical protein D918_01194 [Trichuris suis]
MSTALSQSEPTRSGRLIWENEHQFTVNEYDFLDELEYGAGSHRPTKEAVGTTGSAQNGEEHLDSPRRRKKHEEDVEFPDSFSSAYSIADYNFHKYLLMQRKKMYGF